MNESKTLTEVLARRAQETPDKTAYVFSPNREEARFISYGDLYRSGLAFAERLAQEPEPSGTVVLLFSAGLEFLIAFFGCLYAGRIAVPVSNRKINRSAETLDRILNDACCRLIVSQAEFLQVLANGKNFGPIKEKTRLIEFTRGNGRPESRGFAPSDIREEDIAFIQYTSGSTSRPKGVVLTHANIMADLDLIQRMSELEESDMIANWLPHYHDMGLIGHLLTTIYTGTTCVIMSPALFLNRPLTWLEILSDFRVQMSGGPNFGYDYCVKKLNVEDLKGLNLSQWNRVVNGAEPIRPETLSGFAGKFKICGFDYRHFMPCYGMAEASVFITGKPYRDQPKVVYLDRRAINRHEVRYVKNSAADENIKVGLVACGAADGDEKIIITDPETGGVLKENEIGEVCVSGPNVMSGYFGTADYDPEYFLHRYEKGVDRHYFKTGDLGFLDEERNVYITGRRKDLMILNGVNIYPQDVEKAVEDGAEEVRPAGVCAFEMEYGQCNKLVVLVEWSRTKLADLARNPQYLKNAVERIKGAIALQSDVLVHRLVFLKPGAILKTSSAKVRRQACKRDFAARRLEAVAEWVEPDPGPEISEQAQQESMRRVFDLLDFFGQKSDQHLRIYTAIVRIFLKQYNISAHDIDPSKPLLFYGVDSVKLVDLQNALENDLQIKIPTEIFFESTDIAALVDHIRDCFNGQHLLGDVFRSIQNEISDLSRELSSLFRMRHEQLTPSRETSRNILITGTGGFIGAHILHELLTRTDARLYCLIRLRNYTSGMERLRENLALYRKTLTPDQERRITILVGDIARKNLGLGSQEYENLAKNVDLIFHCAAVDNFYFPYSTLKSVNVYGMVHLIELAVTSRLKSIYYTSSCSATLIDDSMPLNRITGLVNGYSQTKHVAEKILTHLVQEGFPGYIFKLGYLYARNTDMIHLEDGFESFISIFEDMRAIPDMDCDFDMTPVEYVVNGMIDQSLAGGRNGKHFYLAYNPSPLQWRNVVRYFRKIRPEIEVLPLKEFARRFREYLNHEDRRHIKLLATAITEDLERQLNQMFRHRPEVDLFETHHALCPPCDERFTEYYLKLVLNADRAFVENGRK